MMNWKTIKSKWWHRLYRVVFWALLALSATWVIFWTAIGPDKAGVNTVGATVIFYFPLLLPVVVGGLYRAALWIVFGKIADDVCS